MNKTAMKIALKGAKIEKMTTNSHPRLSGWEQDTSIHSLELSGCTTHYTASHQLVVWENTTKGARKSLNNWLEKKGFLVVDAEYAPNTIRVKPVYLS